MQTIERFNVAIERAEAALRLQYRIAAQLVVDDQTLLHYALHGEPARWGLYVQTSTGYRPLKDTPIAMRMQVAPHLPVLAARLAQAAQAQRDELTMLTEKLEAWLVEYEVQAIEFPDSVDKSEND